LQSGELLFSTPMIRSSFLSSLLALAALLTASAQAADPAPTPLVVGQQAPEFKIRDASGNEINLADLTAKGPVLVRLTCGCLGCNKELTYFQELHAAYKDKGLTSLAIFREPTRRWRRT